MECYISTSFCSRDPYGKKIPYGALHFYLILLKRRIWKRDYIWNPTFLLHFAQETHIWKRDSIWNPTFLLHSAQETHVYGREIPYHPNPSPTKTSSNWGVKPLCLLLNEPLWVGKALAQALVHALLLGKNCLNHILSVR